MAFLTDQQISDIKLAYVENCDYDLGAGDVAKARNFLAACRKLLLIQPALAMHTAAGGQHQVMIDTKLLPAQEAKVFMWLQINDSAVAALSPRSTQLVLDGFRD